MKLSDLNDLKEIKYVVDTPVAPVSTEPEEVEIEIVSDQELSEHLIDLISKTRLNKLEFAEQALWDAIAQIVTFANVREYPQADFVIEMIEYAYNPAGILISEGNDS